MKREDPLNLSILLRGGKETNKDSLSNGEWSGKSSEWKSFIQTGKRIVIWRRVVSGNRGLSLLEQSTIEGESPVHSYEFATYDACS